MQGSGLGRRGGWQGKRRLEVGLLVWLWEPSLRQPRLQSCNTGLTAAAKRSPVDVGIQQLSGAYCQRAGGQAFMRALDAAAIGQGVGVGVWGNGAGTVNRGLGRAGEPRAENMQRRSCWPQPHRSTLCCSAALCSCAPPPASPPKHHPINYGVEGLRVEAPASKRGCMGGRGRKQGPLSARHGANRQFLGAS